MVLMVVGGLAASEPTLATAEAHDLAAIHAGLPESDWFLGYSEEDRERLLAEAKAATPAQLVQLLLAVDTIWADRYLAAQGEAPIDFHRLVGQWYLDPERGGEAVRAAWQAGAASTAQAVALLETTVDRYAVNLNGYRRYDLSLARERALWDLLAGPQLDVLDATKGKLFPRLVDQPQRLAGLDGTAAIGELVERFAEGDAAAASDLPLAVWNMRDQLLRDRALRIALDDHLAALVAACARRAAVDPGYLLGSDPAGRALLVTLEVLITDDPNDRYRSAGPFAALCQQLIAAWEGGAVDDGFLDTAPELLRLSARLPGPVAASLHEAGLPGLIQRHAEDPVGVWAQVMTWRCDPEDDARAEPLLARLDLALQPVEAKRAEIARRLEAEEVFSLEDEEQEVHARLGAVVAVTDYLPAAFIRRYELTTRLRSARRGIEGHHAMALGKTLDAVVSRERAASRLPGVTTTAGQGPDELAERYAAGRLSLDRYLTAMARLEAWDDPRLYDAVRHDHQGRKQVANVVDLVKVFRHSPVDADASYVTWYWQNARPDVRESVVAAIVTRPFPASYRKLLARYPRMGTPMLRMWVARMAASLATASQLDELAAGFDAAITDREREQLALAWHRLAADETDATLRHLLDVIAEERWSGRWFHAWLVLGLRFPTESWPLAAVRADPALILESEAVRAALAPDPAGADPAAQP